MTLRKIRPSCKRAAGLASGGDEAPSSRDLLVTTFSASDAPNEDLFMRPAAAAADHWKLMLIFLLFKVYRSEKINKMYQIVNRELMVDEQNKRKLGKRNNKERRNDEMDEIKRERLLQAPFIHKKTRG